MQQKFHQYFLTQIIKIFLNLKEEYKIYGNWSYQERLKNEGILQRRCRNEYQELIDQRQLMEYLGKSLVEKYQFSRKECTGCKVMNQILSFRLYTLPPNLNVSDYKMSCISY